MCMVEFMIFRLDHVVRVCLTCGAKTARIFLLYNARNKRVNPRSQYEGHTISCGGECSWIDRTAGTEAADESVGHPNSRSSCFSASSPTQGTSLLVSELPGRMIWGEPSSSPSSGIFEDWEDISGDEENICGLEVGGEEDMSGFVPTEFCEREGEGTLK